MQRSGGRTPAARLRQTGTRVSSGAWVLCAAKAQTKCGRLIVALGRTAGQAVTRSRIRRLAREVCKTNLPDGGGALDLLLFVRKEVNGQPRRKVRGDLERLLARVPEALRRRETREVPSALAERDNPPSP